MIPIASVRSSNEGIRAFIPGITALFVGGTTGIGQSTLHQLALRAKRPNAYIIGRSEAKAAPFLAQLRKLNPEGSWTFIETDVSLIRNVDAACEFIRNREQRVNLLFMTPGGIPITRRRETNEGLDSLFTLRYYARMRFIQNLLPLLEPASSTLARVVSIFGGGLESRINKDDLDLKRTYSVLNCARHAITMTSLSMEHLALAHRSVSFLHVYPWLVGTNIYNNSFPPPVSHIMNRVIWPLFMRPFAVDLRESGERHLFHSTSSRYPSRDKDASNPTKGQGVPLPESELEGFAVGSDGEVGSGAYLVNWKGEGKVGNQIMQQYRAQGMSEHVWGHTTDILNAAVRG